MERKKFSLSEVYLVLQDAGIKCGVIGGKLYLKNKHGGDVLFEDFHTVATREGLLEQKLILKAKEALATRKDLGGL